MLALLMVFGGCYSGRHPIPQNADPRERAALTALLPFADGVVLWNERGRIQVIDLVGDAITSEDIKQIAVFSDLESLRLMAPVKDEDFACLESLPRLNALDLSWTRISDAGVERLSRIETLKYLGLAHTNITNKSLDHLTRLKNLEILSVDGTSVSRSAVERFRKIRPTCTVRESAGRGIKR